MEFEIKNVKKNSAFTSVRFLNKFYKKPTFHAGPHISDSNSSMFGWGNSHIFVCSSWNFQVLQVLGIPNSKSSKRSIWELLKICTGMSKCLDEIL